MGGDPKTAEGSEFGYCFGWTKDCDNCLSGPGEDSCLIYRSDYFEVKCFTPDGGQARVQMPAGSTCQLFCPKHSKKADKKVATLYCQDDKTGFHSWLEKDGHQINEEDYRDKCGDGPGSGDKCPPIDGIKRVKTSCGEEETRPGGKCKLECEEPGLQLGEGHEMHGHLVCKKKGGRVSWFTMADVMITVEKLRSMEMCPPDGSTTDGTTTDGTTPDGTTTDGSTPDGTTTDGTTSDGTTPEGTTPEWTTPSETTSEVTTPYEITTPDGTTTGVILTQAN